MHVTEERLSQVLTAGPPGLHLSDRNPVAALIVESMAATHPEHGDRVRQAGRFLCDLLWPPGPTSGPALTLPVAMHTFVREEHTTPAEMRAHLARTMRRDTLLGLSAHALLTPPQGLRRSGRSARETEAVLRTLYVLMRMYETQEETDALERALTDSGGEIP